MYDDSEEICSLFNMIPSSQWQADDMLEYEELVKCVESRLDGIFLRIFRAKLEMPIDFEDKTNSTKVNCRTLAIYFGIKFPDTIKINKTIQDIVLSVVREYMEEDF